MKIKYLLFVLFFFLFTLNQGFGKDRQGVVSERIVLHTDRKVYTAGENLLFNLYLMDTKTRSLAEYPSIGYIVIRNNQGNMVGKAQVKIIEGKAAGAIYLSDTLQSGYYQVFAYTNFMRNGTPEIFFKTQVLIANRFDKDFFGLISTVNSGETVEASPGNLRKGQLLEISNPKTNYGKREKGSVSISLPNSGYKFVSFCVSITEKNPVEEFCAVNVSTGSLNKDAVNFDVAGKNGQPIHLAEDKYAELMGRLTDAGSGNPAGYQVLFLSSPDSVNNFKYTVTNSNGYFRFPLGDYYNGKDLFLKVKQKEGEALDPKFEIDSKFDFRTTFKTEPFPIDSSVISYLKNSQDIVRIQKSFALIQTLYQPKQTRVNVPLLFRVPDYTVLPADYVELKDFIEIAREILPPLRIRKREQVYYAEILDVQKRMFMEPRPLIFFDGVLVDDISQIIGYGTKDIKKVDVISSKWIVDHQVLDGVISVQSHQNLWKNITLNNNNLRIKAENFFELPNLFQPNYSLTDVKSREPNFRQLLYWNPNLRVESGKTVNVEFYTSDLAARYLVKILGVTDTGEIVEAYSEIEVKD